VFFSKYNASKQSSDLEHAFDAFRASVACEYAPLLEAYQAAITLLPRIATLDLDSRSRQESLTSGIDGLARNAAAAAIQSG
jgi:hypothetical protein